MITYDEYGIDREKHEDFYELMEDYQRSNLFDDIIEFMDETFPEWDSNEGVGSWAAEFVLSAIHDLEDDYYDEDVDNKESKETLESYLKGEYPGSKHNYTHVFSNEVLKAFDDEREHLVEQIEDLPKEEFKKEYDKIYNKFEAEYSKRVTYAFRG